MNKIIPYPGLILKPIHDCVNWEDSTAEIVKEGVSEHIGEWYVIEDDNFGCWKNLEQINKDYILINE